MKIRVDKPPIPWTPPWSARHPRAFVVLVFTGGAATFLAFAAFLHWAPRVFGAPGPVVRIGLPIVSAAIGFSLGRAQKRRAAALKARAEAASEGSWIARGES